jgi:hypothetical protein
MRAQHHEHVYAVIITCCDCEIITKGDQVKVPSETLLDFTLQHSVSVPVQQNLLDSCASRGFIDEPLCEYFDSITVGASSK